MRRVFVILATVLCLIGASCSGSTSETSADLPTAVPAPTVAGVEIEPVEPEVPVEIVFIGQASTDAAEVRVLPGLEHPLAGNVPPGTALEKMSEEFQTPDGQVWWQVRAGSVQGWIQPNAASLGPALDITESALATFDYSVVYNDPEESAAVVAQKVADDQGAPEVIVVSRIDAGGGSTVTVDLLGFEDDSLLGFRLLVASSANSGYQPVKVTQFPLCARGVTTDGLCL